MRSTKLNFSSIVTLLSKLFRQKASCPASCPFLSWPFIHSLTSNYHQIRFDRIRNKWVLCTVHTFTSVSAVSSVVFSTHPHLNSVTVLSEIMWWAALLQYLHPPTAGSRLPGVTRRSRRSVCFSIPAPPRTVSPVTTRLLGAGTIVQYTVQSLQGGRYSSY